MSPAANGSGGDGRGDPEALGDDRRASDLPDRLQKPGTGLAPLHPRAEVFDHRHWLGILAEAGEDDLRDMAHCLRTWRARDTDLQASATVILAGWAMDNRTPRALTWSVQPMISRIPEGLEALARALAPAAQGQAEQPGPPPPVRSR